MLKKLKVNKNDTWIQEHISLAGSQAPSANRKQRYRLKKEKHARVILLGGN